MTTSTSPTPLQAASSTPVPKTEFDDEHGEPGVERLTHDLAHDEETSSPEDRLIDKLMVRLVELGIVTARPTTTTEPLGEPSHETRDENPGWERPWKDWSESWSSHDRWTPDTGDDWKT